MIQPLEILENIDFDFVVSYIEFMCINIVGKEVFQYFQAFR